MLGKLNNVAPEPSVWMICQAAPTDRLTPAGSAIWRILLSVPSARRYPLSTCSACYCISCLKQVKRPSYQSNKFPAHNVKMPFSTYRMSARDQIRRSDDNYKS